MINLMAGPSHPTLIAMNSLGSEYKMKWGKAILLSIWILDVNPSGMVDS